MSPSTASTAMITRGMLKTGSRFTGGSDGTARSYAASRFSARQSGEKEKGGLSPSLSRVAGVLPPLAGWSHPIASPRLSVKTGAPTLTRRAHPANSSLVLTLFAVPPASGHGRHKPCTTRDATPKKAVRSSRGTHATSPGRSGQASHDAGAVQLLDEKTRQAPRARLFRY